jgi:predicted TIM-barrel fold metal-dependent hydrolase
MSIEGIIDLHTHAFPDELAARAIAALEQEATEAGSEVRAFHDGTVDGLLNSMDEAGIETSVLCSIATRPEQFDSILKWSSDVSSERIIPFPSFHPDDRDFAERIRVIAGEGFKGVKFHPYYQDFYLSEDKMMPVYEALMEHGLMIMMHTGYDIAFERIRRCDPRQVLEVYGRFPGIKLITTHLGAWEQWDEVREMLLGRPVYMEISFSVEFLGQGLREFIEGHPEGYVLFGTDAPWTGQKETLESVMGLGLGKGLLEGLIRGNARKLLGLS